MQSRILQVLETQRMPPLIFCAEVVGGAGSVDVSVEGDAGQARRVAALLLRLPGVEAAVWYERRDPMTAAEMMRVALALRAEDSEGAIWTEPQAPFWSAAPAVYLRTNNAGKAEREHETEVRLRWTKEALWVRFACPYVDLHLRSGPARLETPTEELWTNDVAEVFVGDEVGMPARYQEFEVSPRGEWLDLQIEHGTDGVMVGTPLGSRFMCGALIEEARSVWTAVVQIPLRTFYPEGAQAGNSLRMNLFRSQGPLPLELAWQPTRRASFHRPSCFGTLLLI